MVLLFPNQPHGSGENGFGSRVRREITWHPMGAGSAGSTAGGLPSAALSHAFLFICLLNGFGFGPRSLLCKQTACAVLGAAVPHTQAEWGGQWIPALLEVWGSPTGSLPAAGLSHSASPAAGGLLLHLLLLHLALRCCCGAVAAGRAMRGAERPDDDG